jgi:hypothetical protein
MPFRRSGALPQPPAGVAPEPVLGLEQGVSGDGQVGDENLSFRLRAQQDRDQEDRQAHHRSDEDRTRKGDLVGGAREPRKSE